jgi:hypothetical protein
MSGPISRGWRRDLFVACLASLLTVVVLVPLARATQQKEQQRAEAFREEAQAAMSLAKEKAAEADQQRDLARRTLVEQAADFTGFGDKTGAEVMRVMTEAISPEVPKDGWLLIDKKASSWATGDIVVFRQGGNNYLGRIIAYAKAGGRMTVGRNGEKNREIILADVMGRGVLNSR